MKRFLILLLGILFLGSWTIFNVQLSLTTSPQLIKFPFYVHKVRIDNFDNNSTDTVYYRYGFDKGNNYLLKVPGGRIYVDEFPMNSKVDSMYVWSNTNGLKVTITGFFTKP